MSLLWSSKINGEEGPYKVLLKRGEFTDPSRRNDDGSVRIVPYKIYYPSAKGGLKDCPVVLWSHGLGGSRDGAGFLARYIASHGYIIVHMTHVGTDSSLWEGKGGAHPWDIIRDTNITRTTTLNRYKDISFVIDRLFKWVREHADIASIVDLSKIGMCGHSFGAITTQVAVGQLTPDEDGQLMGLREPRIKAAIAYSPVPGTSHLSRDMEDATRSNIYKSISIPMLHMTGTDDSSPLNGLDYKGRLVVYENTVNAPKAMLVKHGGDHMVYNGTRGALAANPLRDRHECIVKVISLAWWETWLRGDSAAQSWLLETDRVRGYLRADADWEDDFDH